MEQVRRFLGVGTPDRGADSDMDVDASAIYLLLQAIYCWSRAGFCGLPSCAAACWSTSRTREVVGVLTSSAFQLPAPTRSSRSARESRVSRFPCEPVPCGGCRGEEARRAAAVL